MATKVLFNGIIVIAFTYGYSKNNFSPKIDLIKYLKKVKIYMYMKFYLIYGYKRVAESKAGKEE